MFCTLKDEMAMTEYVKAMRLPVCIYCGLLTLSSFRIAFGSFEGAWLPSLSTILIAIATMAHNDWRDRFNDYKKGKCFAFEHPLAFGCFVLNLWLIAVFLTTVLYFINPYHSLLTSGMIVSGLIYSETRQMPFVPNLIVALTVASSLLFPICNGCLSNPIIWAAFAVMFLTMYGREILKDFDDKEIDPGYKWSLIQKYNQDAAKMIAVLLFVAAARLVDILTISFFSLPGRLMAEPALELALNEPTPEIIARTKLYMDFCLAIIAAILLFG